MRTLGTIIVVFILVGVGIYGSYYVKQYQQNQAKAVTASNPETPDDLEIIQPKLDIRNGKKLLVTPGLGGVLQVKTSKGITVTLAIPPGALLRQQTVSLVPFSEDTNRSTLDAGVMVTPGTLVFTRPVTLAFSLAGTQRKNNAPAIDPSKPRFYGMSHIYRLIPKRQSITPVLIARAAEDSTTIPGRILSGGAYTLSLVSSRGEALSRVTLADKNSRATTILEATSFLVATHKSLSVHEMRVVNAAIHFVTQYPQAPLPEVFTALALDKQFSGKEDGIVQIEAGCGTVGYSNVEYISGAATARLYSNTSDYTNCLNMAKSATPYIVDTDLQPIIGEASPSSDLINSTIDTYNQDGYSVILPTEEDGNFNSILQEAQDPTPTPPEFSDSKF
jgi:hypothetical protein